ncbi:MAG: ATP-dependent carboxylate-amine ligase [Gammaproteobacteria bacterium HGW-Gammaproteobacteria-10]|nr:MAG: ATP-dependent carboxylate-amine ligase [Gammaproteobacteria bacterium HGW-Gammaproteobacteria-10]
MKSSIYKPILIIANSGRMLAEAARCSGFIPWVIDLFADQDTLNFSERAFRIEALNSPSLKTIVADFSSRHPMSPVIYGSGLEHYPKALELISRECELIGNDIKTIRLIQQKKLFFELLDHLEIDYPRVSFTEPKGAEQWLVKPESGEGGLGIRRFRAGMPTQGNMYWQKYIEGTACSALFLANGKNIRIIGFHTQWCENLNADQPFLFAGVINRCPLSAEQADIIHSWITALVRAIPLKGLNTLDFIIQGERIYVLEANPRPSASMQLYDGDLFGAHLNACRGILDNTNFTSHTVCAYRIIYADRSITIPDAFCWPKACRDLPIAGSIIRKGQPICSIIARDINVRNVQRQLNEIRQTIFQSFN